MTREEALKVIRHMAYLSAHVVENGVEAYEYIEQLLSKPSLPSNLDEAAIDAAQLDMQDRQIMEATNDERLRYSRIFRRGFKAGVEWMADKVLL